MKDENISPIKSFFLNKWVWAILVLNVVLIIVMVLFYINNASKTAAVNFTIAPVDATISINGDDSYKSNGEAYYFAPGTYEIEISHESLDKKVFTVDLKEDHNTTVATFLSKDGDFGFYELSENINSYYALANIAASENNITIDNDTSAEGFIKNVQNNFELVSDMLPIVDKTPTGYGLEYGMNYQYNTLKIQDGSYLEDCGKILCLYITDTSGEKEQYSMSIIEKFGFDVNLCQIIYRKVSYE